MRRKRGFVKRYLRKLLGVLCFLAVAVLLSAIAYALGGWEDVKLVAMMTLGGFSVAGLTVLGVKLCCE